MTSASGGRNRVAHHCKVDWCHLVKTLEYQQCIVIALVCMFVSLWVRLSVAIAQCLHRL